LLKYGDSAGLDQIYSFEDVVVAGSGKWDLNNHSDAVNSLTLNMNTKSSAEVQTGDNLQQTLNTGTTGTFQLAFNGARPGTSEIQIMTLGGGNGTFALQFTAPGGSPVAGVGTLLFTNGVGPTATEVQNYLNTIPSMRDNVQVNAGPGVNQFTIFYVNGLNGTNINPTAIA